MYKPPQFSNKVLSEISSREPFPKIQNVVFDLSTPTIFEKSGAGKRLHSRADGTLFAAYQVQNNTFFAGVHTRDKGGNCKTFQLRVQCI